jgi:phage gpG-like protein
VSQASFTADLSALNDLLDRLGGSALRAKVEEIPKLKGVAALISQAIKENFDKEGPGWKPLQAGTIRASLAKATQKDLKKISDKSLLAHEAANSGTDSAFRQILKRKGLLQKSVTTPGAPGNIYRVEGTKIIWGTNLIYARIHNKGGVIKPVNAKALVFPNGHGGVVFAKKVTIPKREYLKLNDEAVASIMEFALGKIAKAIREVIRGK